MIAENEAELRVQLRLPQATCKARDRREAGDGLLQINSGRAATWLGCALDNVTR